MLEPILGSANAEKVLIFILARGEGYAREIARFFETSLNPIQKQLEKFEAAGVLVSCALGKTRIYSMNPRYPFRKPLASLLQRALEFYPKEQTELLLMNRKRPRRAGKPL